MINKYLLLLCMVSWVIQTNAGELNIQVTDGKGDLLPSVVVIATPEQSKASATKPEQTVIIDQIDKEFVRYVTAIPVGSSVQFPNKDNIRHHVYSFSPAKQFELPLYMGMPAKPVIFDKPGVVKLGCNIHDWMVGYLYITDAPFFEVTDNDGKAQLSHLPAGKYNVQFWHPRMETTNGDVQQTLVIGEAEKKSFAFQIALKPELRARRAPMTVQSGY